MRGGARYTLARDRSPFISCLDTPLLQLSPSDPFTLRDACNGVHCWGAIGSGKTSGPGKALAGAYLRAGMGGIWLCAKPDEVELALSYARANGRLHDVIIFGEGKGFDPLSWELGRQGMQGIGAVVDCLMRILEAADHASGAAAKPSEEIWRQLVRQFIAHAVPLLYAAWGRVTIADIVAFVTSAAKTKEQYTDQAFIGASLAARTLGQVMKAPAVPLPDAQSFIDYFIYEYTAIPDKMRGSGVASLAAKLDRFKFGRMKSLFCGATTIVPEMCFHGAIIILNMPVLTWNDDGVIAQCLFKYCFERAVEARNGLHPSQRERPVFEFADEGHYFLTPSSEAFLSTCRGARCCVVYMSQTLPTYYARIGQDQSAAADGLVGKFNTQIFCLNSCIKTNEYASKLIGRDVTWRRTKGASYGTNNSRGMNEGANANKGNSSNHGSSTGGQSSSWNHSSGDSSGSGTSWGGNVGKGTSAGESWSEAENMDNLIEPRFFANNLKSGGPRHGNLVTAIWFKAGAAFEEADGSNWLTVTFRQ